MKIKYLFACVVIVLFVSTACSGGASSRAASEGARATTAAAPATVGALSIDLRTEPDPPTPGRPEFFITVKDADGQPVENADVTLGYEMTTMSMGLSSGKASDTGGGVYAIKSSLDHGGVLSITVEVFRQNTPLGTQQFEIEVK